MSDNINHPKHYTHGSIECADVIDQWKLPWTLANVVKYLCRYKHKRQPLEDLRKALWYAQRYRDSLPDVYEPGTIADDWNLSTGAERVLVDVWHCAVQTQHNAEFLLMRITELIAEEKAKLK